MASVKNQDVGATQAAAVEGKKSLNNKAKKKSY